MAEMEMRRPKWKCSGGWSDDEGPSSDEFNQVVNMIPHSINAPPVSVTQYTINGVLEFICVV